MGLPDYGASTVCCVLFLTVVEIARVFFQKPSPLIAQLLDFVC